MNHDGDKQTVHSGMDFKASEKDKIALNAQDVQSRSMSSLQTEHLSQ